MSNMKLPEDYNSKKISIDLSIGHYPKIVIGDLDISNRVKGLKITGGTGLIPGVELELVPDEINVTMDQVPIMMGKSIKDFPLEDITKELSIRMCKQLIKDSRRK